jgi:hypothetical protein
MTDDQWKELRPLAEEAARAWRMMMESDASGVDFYRASVEYGKAIGALDKAADAAGVR